MKSKKITRYEIISIIVILTFLFSVVSLEAIGVTRPVPHDIELMRGESARFVFEIQAVTSTEKVACIYSISDLGPLIIEFDEEEAIIDAGSIKKVYGTVSVHEDAEYKTYNGKLCVTCGVAMENEASGSSVKTTIGSSPFNINIVEFRGKEIKQIDDKVQKKYYLEIIIIASILILIIGVCYHLKHKKKK